MAFSKRSKFDALLIVSTAVRKNELSLEQTADNLKIQKKKITRSKKTKESVSDIDATYETVKSLTDKSLVDQYTERIFDELNKKYSYKCTMLPSTCMQVFESYGNELRALRDMKVHLSNHVRELSHSETLQATTSSSDTSSEMRLTNSSTVYSNCKEVMQTSESENCAGTFSSVVKQADTPLWVSKSNDKFNEINFPFLHKYTKQSVHISEYLNPIGSGNSSAEFDDGPSSETSNSLPGTSNDTSCIDIIPEVVPSRDRSVPLHHEYTSYNNLTLPKAVKKRKRNSGLTLDGMLEQKEFPPQFIIKTPEDPYVHIPNSFVDVEVVEFSQNCVTIACSDIAAPYKVPPYSADVKKILYPYRGKKPLVRMQNVTGSVLECVENKKDIKIHPMVGTSKNPNESVFLFRDENSENHEQEAVMSEKDIALKEISRLKMMKKRKMKTSFLCIICLKTFTASASLLHHYRGHACLKEFQCDLCSKTFTRRHSLDYHAMIHTGKSRFNCTVCTRQFRHPSHYKEHLRKHTGETPYDCEYCIVQFKTRNTYKRHLRAKHNKVLTATGIQDA